MPGPWDASLRSAPPLRQGRQFGPAPSALSEVEVRCRDSHGPTRAVPRSRSGPRRAPSSCITAARISPPSYIRSELGERPSDPIKRKAWDRGVAQIEGYRQSNGVTDQRNTFGKEAKRGVERARQVQAQHNCLRPSARLAWGNTPCECETSGVGWGSGAGALELSSHAALSCG